MKVSPPNILVIGAFSALLFMLVLPYFQLETMELVLLRFPGIDKIVHFSQHFCIVLGVYFILGTTSNGKDHYARVASAVGISVLFSFLDEFIQRYSAGRSFEIADIAVNTLGALSGSLAVSFRRIKRLPWYAGMVLLVFFTTAITYQSYLKIAPYYAGMTLEKNGQFIQARELYAQALKAGNTNAGLLDAIAWLDMAYLDGDPAYALELTQKAIAKNNHNGNYLDTHALALLKNNQPEEALFFLKQAYEIDPDLYTIHYHFAMAYRDLGQTEKAIEHFTRQIQKTPEQHYGRQSRIEITKIKAQKRQ